jgi:hypothetical protein
MGECHRRVPQRVEGIKAVEACFHLLGAESELDSALADADAGLGAEKGITRGKPFPTGLVCPESSEFRQENIALSPTLGDFGPDSEAISGLSLVAVDIPHVHPYNFGQS